MATCSRPGETDPVLRQPVALSAAGGPPAQPPYGTLARQIGEAANRTTDADVANVVRATGSEKATFEVIVAAAVSAGLLRELMAVMVAKWNSCCAQLHGVFTGRPETLKHDFFVKLL